MKQLMYRIVPFMLVGGFLLTGCNDTAESSSTVPSEIVVAPQVGEETAEVIAFPVEVCGVEIAAAPNKVISLSPAVTEIIAELEYTARLRGISSYCDYPELSLQRVGSSENPDVEVITGMSPDVVFTLSGLSERDIYAINAEGSQVVTLLPPSTIEDYGRLYADIASVFAGASEGAAAGEAAVDYLTSASGKAQLGGFIYVTDKLTAAGAGTFENAVLSLCGENLCTEEGYSELLSLTEAAPQYIIASDRLTYDDIKGDDTLSAMISGGAEVLYVSAAYFERPTARTAEIFAQLEQQLSGGTSEA